MDFRKLLILLAAVLALGIVACNGDDKDSDADGSPEGGPDADTDVDSDSDADIEDWVGMPCDPPEEEGDEDPCPGITGHDNASCFAWSDAPGGFCTMECTPAEYPDNPIDGCGMMEFNVVCMDISQFTADTADDEEGYGLCVETCVPTPDGGDPQCEADYMKCDPQTWAWENQFSTCLLPKCQSDADCLVASGPECASDGDCSAADGETCSDDGYCVFEATCDEITGRCNWEGDDSAEIGDPCESSWDCGDNGVCFTDDGSTDDYGKPYMQNGYCTKTGCKAANSAAENGSGSADPAIDAEFGCGMLGSCQAGFSYGGICMRRCSPDHATDAFRCRQAVWDSEVLDDNGQYECVDSTNYGYWIPTSGETMMYIVMPYPSCYYVMDGVGLKCGDGEYDNDSANCDTIYASSGGWSLGMSCRDWMTGEADTEGYCLDETTSGPTESWGSDTDVDTDSDTDVDTDADTDSDADSGPDAAPDAGDAG